MDADESKGDDPSEWKESKEADADAGGESSPPNPGSPTPGTAATVDAATDRAHAACTAEGDRRQVQNEPFDDTWLRRTASQWALHVRDMALEASPASMSAVTSPPSLTTTLESTMASTMAYTTMTSPGGGATRRSPQARNRLYASVFDRLSNPDHFIGAERAKHEAKLRSMLIAPGACPFAGTQPRVCLWSSTFQSSSHSQPLAPVATAPLNFHSQYGLPHRARLVQTSCSFMRRL